MPTSVLPTVSVIISVLNEQATIGATVESVCAYFDAKGMSYEVIVVNDGSTDQTAEVVQSLFSKYPMVRMLDNGMNMGKGFGVRNGMLHATGDIALFMDADNSTKITEFEKVWAKYSEGYGVVIGSRQIAGARIAVHQSRLREQYGRLMNRIITIMTGLEFADTQAGFKAFSRQARETIFGLQRMSRWMFDVELLIIARANNISIAEIPIAWENNPNSRVKLSHIGKIIVELIAIKLNAMRGLYRRRA